MTQHDELEGIRAIVEGQSDQYVREPAHDRRIRRGDAWRDRETGELRYVAVGQNPNTD